MLKNHMSTCKKTHVNMQHLFLMCHRCYFVSENLKIGVKVLIWG